MSGPAFGWWQVLRVGLIQAALGSVVVLTTSTLNRIMVVELALPALLPGLLVVLHHAMQALRPRMGHGSDVGGRRTPWIVGGMAVLAVGGVLAAVATTWMATDRLGGTALAVLGFALIGLGVSACGTSLLVLLAKRVLPERRAGGATLVWLMMIAGCALTAGISGNLLDPYSPARLQSVAAGISAIALLLTLLAVHGLEGPAECRVPLDEHAQVALAASERHTARPDFRIALREVWDDPGARRFSLFVFLSMLAYSAQDLILEPFAGLVMGYTPGESTRLSGVQHGGVLVGMLAATLAGRRWQPTWLKQPALRWIPAPRAWWFGSLRAWMVWGCAGSALAMAGLVVSALVGPGWPFRLNVWCLGAANGAFSIAAIGSMMQLASDGGEHRSGVRMGLFGAAQAFAFAFGGLVGAASSDVARSWVDAPGLAYASVFAAEAVLFIIAAWFALGGVARRVADPRPAAPRLATDREAFTRAPRRDSGSPLSAQPSPGRST